MAEFLATDFAKACITFLISMAPVFECRAAIPTGVAYGLPNALVFILAAVGNFLPIPFIILFIRKIFAWLRTKSAWLERVVSRLERRAEGKADTIRKYSALGLMIFVAIPLPGTGAWTGALIAAMLGIRMRQALPAITMGILIACALVMFLSLGAKAAIQFF